MLRKPRKRISFHEREDILDLPNLIEIQVKSYGQFLQKDIDPEERVRVGLQEVFQEIFPIKSFDEKTVLEYISYNLGIPKYDPEECVRRGITYNATLRVKFRLTDETGIKEEEVYMGTVPLMTDQGTFIINGAERVVVSQLHRSPGICFEQDRHPRGGMIYSMRIIPYRGSWLEAAFDSADCINIYVDRKKRKKKIIATAFLRCLGLSSNADILEEFFPIKKAQMKSEKDFVKYVGKVLAQDVVDEEKGLVFGRAAEKLTTAMLKRMVDAEMKTFYICEGADESHPVIRMIARDPTTTYETALKDFYRKIRPGEPATLANARTAIMRLYFDPKRYNLGRVGRYKLNSKLGFEVNDETLENVTLRREDVIAAIKYLIQLKSGDDKVCVDDIDHLGNRRVRSVGELVQNQCRIGLARMEKIIRERMNLFDFTSDTLTPSKIISAKALATVLKDFFGRSQLSQFMDQTNPVSELTHKRRLSALGPGGLDRGRAGFEVRDVHPSHYGRICPIETPEGPNIGLITSLSTYAKINEFGFIETPYRIVRDGVVTDEIVYMMADQEARCVIAQATVPIDKHGMLAEGRCWARKGGETMEIETSQVTHVDVSPKQMVSVVTGLIPFLEHDDANRALMGSNMQRQAVPLVHPEAPYVGTGLERRAAKDSGAIVFAEEDGIVEYVDGFKIIICSSKNKLKKRTYFLKKFLRSNSGTCINQRPICSVGDKVKAGDVIADGPATDRGELAIGRNVLVGFMPWRGYNFEDAIIVSEKLLANDYYTSIHIEEFEVTARETKLGKEEITRDIPNISEEALCHLGEDGIISIGAEVKPGDILVGKITPKSETELAPEERLLRAIFGEKAADVRDASLTAPPGVEGVVMDVKIFTRRDKLTSKTEEEQVEEATRLKDIQKEYKNRLSELKMDRRDRIGALLLNERAPSSVAHRKTAEILIEESSVITQAEINLLDKEVLNDLILPQDRIWKELKEIFISADKELEKVDAEFKTSIEHLKKGDVELESGVIRQVKVYIASKRKLQVGDKMAGRHGNKGVVSNVVQEADMPYMQDGHSIEMVLNPLGVPSRMNIGQILETHLGLVANKTGIYVKTPVFEGFPEWKIWEMMKEQGFPGDGKMYLYDGCTGERFDQPVVVGYIYMLKLSHLVVDKIHARAVGPYSLVTQQPLGGKAQMGGQRFGEMEVWALEAYGAANLLQEILTVKSDDVAGRTRIYESIVKGENLLKSGTPESFNVLVKEMQGLGLDVRTESVEEAAAVSA